MHQTQGNKEEKGGQRKCDGVGYTASTKGMRLSRVDGNKTGKEDSGVKYVKVKKYISSRCHVTYILYL